MPLDITVTTPALLFPTLSLLLLAYTNRFLVVGQLIRDLSARHRDHPNPQIIDAQLRSLRQRVVLMRQMQMVGVLSLIGCVLTMLLLFFGQALAGKLVFSTSLILMVVSLLLCLREVQLSCAALNIALSEISGEPL